ncbi:hypothetical protein D9757_011689 [Collybiopsis confluens]|uniref:Uncharacterized protein n=1 Tax=Collybiopsis confluens TaxID=2823264 RepID=A0A8H5LRX8_9AGAR|nr:hypothetical protein D9757_011689 [Collybiopsis confluens]
MGASSTMDASSTTGFLCYPWPKLPEALPLELDQDLQSLFDEYYNLLSQYSIQANNRTRAQKKMTDEQMLAEWRGPWIAYWLNSETKTNAVLNWLSEAIHIESDYVDDISYEDAINLFLSVFILLKLEKHTEALMELCSWQRSIALKLDQTQKNIALDTINEVDDDLDHEPQEDKCKRWEQILSLHLLKTESIATDATFPPVQRKIALTIKEMKNLSPTVYQTEVFQKSVQDTKLGETIAKLSHPAYRIQYPNHDHLLRLYGFSVVLGSVLDSWTPQSKSDSAKMYLSQSPLTGYNEHNKKRMTAGKVFIIALRESSTHIPTLANPLAVFFLCSADNFRNAWRDWLSWSLDSDGYQVGKITDVRLFYEQTMSYLATLRQNTANWRVVTKKWESSLVYIIDRTFILRKMMNTINIDVHQRCSNCGNTRCVQKEFVRLNDDPKFLQDWSGVGVTKVPKAEQMKPRKSRQASQCPKLVHPDHFGLKCIAPNEKIINECGRHIILLYDGKELVDFVYYNAFSIDNGTYSKMKLYSQSSLGVQPVKRGKKFANWTIGQMIPFGARQPSGGRLADHYTVYAGIEAETLEGLTILFEQAEISTIMLLTARSVHPKLAEKIKDASSVCERLGLCGLNVFNCNGYTAPLHFDRDSTPCLSAQIVLQARQDWSEFSFVALQYGYYIQTRENTLWSFNSSYLHGTMLPSESTILGLRNGTTASVGPHLTTRLRDQTRAARNQSVRDNFQVRNHIWGA